MGREEETAPRDDDDDDGARKTPQSQLTEFQAWSEIDEATRRVCVAFGVKDRHGVTFVSSGWIEPNFAKSIGLALLKLSSELDAKAPPTPEQAAKMQRLEDRIAAAEQRRKRTDEQIAENKRRAAK